MTEQNVPPQDSQVPDPQTFPPEEGTGIHASSVNAAEPSTADWEAVTFPGTLAIEQLPQATAEPASANPAPSEPVAPPISKDDFSRRETELLQLIQDLNQCNDALLRRIGDLEEALERAETALQIEVERSQQNQSITSAEAQAAIMQQQQQVAQLLSELDIANDAVRRTTIHNETLQANLDTTRQRVAQLERECTLLQRRFTEKSNALSQAEATCRDLRSRLQRQQHYTLQFKAALEKCLDVSVQRTPEPVPEFRMVAEEPVPRPHPLSMPKAQQIQPWSSEEAISRPDPTLGGLLRNLKSVSQGPSTPVTPTAQPMPSQAAIPDPPSDPEAEISLWQDLERVIETSAAQPTASTPVMPPVLDSSPAPTSLAESEEPELAFTEPSPWGDPLPSTPVGKKSPLNLEHDVEPIVVGSTANPESVPNFLPEPLSCPVIPPTLPSASSTAMSTAAPTATLPPLLDNRPQAQTPSPLVYPLRPQKKLKSVAAVQLPSFPRKQRSQ
ncbi:MAG TPA: hypothetical protein V6D29_18945 [Leptolyngbyaceae cyanobacterium]